MPKITYIEHNGKSHTINVSNGLSVMEGAVQNNISGIDAVWDITEVSEADALAFAQAIWADAEIDSDGMITSQPM